MEGNVEFLSCIRPRGGQNNNPKVFQFKYAIRKNMMRNHITLWKYANCVDITGFTNISFPYKKEQKIKHKISSKRLPSTMIQVTSFPQVGI